jgi:imidazolonepropionase-like amidohydrolase
MKTKITNYLIAIIILSFTSSVIAQHDHSMYRKDKVPASQQDPDIAKEILIKNVKIFNGTDGTLITGKDVVILGNKIDKIIPAGGNEKGYHEVIDGKGGFLTPGLIDCHTHALLGVTEEEFFGGAQPAYVNIFAGKEAGETLMRGVTTIRDAAGDTYGLKQAIDKGVIPGPRMYIAGLGMSQISGHGDFRNPGMKPMDYGGSPQSAPGSDGFAWLVTGEVQMMAAVRQNLFFGASQIKICVAGGVSSFTDPLYVIEFTDEEIQAAVAAAADYGTYVMAHSHESAGVIRAVKNGVKSIEHGSMLNEEAAKLMAENDVVYVPSVQVLAQLKPLYTDPIRKAKLQEAMDGTSAAMLAAKKYGVTIGFGTDLLFSYEGRKDQLKDLGLRKQWFTDAEIMIQATGNGSKIVGLTGARNPYGKVGVIEEKAMADILIYNKNPLKDVTAVEDYENNLKLIIKDGKVYKNTL